MKKVVLTEKQYIKLQEFFDNKRSKKLEELSKELMELAVESDFNTDFGLEFHVTGDYITMSVDSELNPIYRRALASISITDNDKKDFINGKKDIMTICSKEQVISEGRYIYLDLKDIIRTIKEEF